MLKYRSYNRAGRLCSEARRIIMNFRIVSYSEVGRPFDSICARAVCQISEGTQIRKIGNLTCGRSVDRLRNYA